MRQRITLATLMCGTALVVIPNIASAQQTTTLGEVVVTAQRVEENLQKAAIAVQAVTGQQISRAGIVDVQAVTKLVPSLQVSSAAGPYPLFYLRGVGNFNGNSLSDSAIAFNVDGVFVARPSSASGVFYDLDRIEVLKGPQGTLYGRNATGGAINIITKDPNHTFTADGQLEIGDYSNVRAQGAVNVPLNDKVAVRGSFQIVSRGGYLSDGTSDDKTQAGRIKARFDLSPDVKLILGGDYSHEGGKGVGAVVATAPGQFAGGPWSGNTDAAAAAIYASTLVFTAGNLLAPLPNDAGAAFNCSIYTGQYPGRVCPVADDPPRMNNTYWGTYGQLTWGSSGGTLTIVPAYRKASLDFVSTAAGFLIDQREHDEQFSVEARFGSRADRALRYLAGVYYLHEGIDSEPTYDSEYNFSSQILRPKTDTVAGFGRLTWAVTDAFRLTGGVRYTWEKKQVAGSFLSQNILCFGAFIPPPAGPQFCFGGVGQVPVPNPTIMLNQEKSWTKPTWRAAAEWDVTPTSLLYASVETGFKSGGFFFSSTNPQYQPETITAYTIGSKNRFLDDRLQLNLEGFYWKYRNQQISHLGFDGAGAITFPTENVGDSTVKGVEGELQFLLTPTTLVGADVQYLDAVYDQYVYSTPYFGAPPAVGCPFTVQAGPPAAAVINCSGFTAPQSPKWTINLNGRQTIHLGKGSLIAEVQTHYQSTTLAGLEFLPIETQASFWSTDLGLTYEAPDAKWSLTGYVRNVENAAVMNAVFIHPLVTIANAAMRPPRTYGAILSVHF